MRVSGFLFSIILIFIISLLPCLNLAAQVAPASSSTPAKKTDAKGGKSQAYSGDPALKRGFELGYDYGMKAGKLDKKEGRKSNPTGHSEYIMAEKRHRSEYGNRGKFISGYQAGFGKGYKAGYSEAKLDKEAAQKAKEREKIEKTKGPSETSTAPLPSKAGSDSGIAKSKEGETPVPKPKPKPKKFNPADDAL